MTEELREKIRHIIRPNCCYLDKPVCPIENNTACECCERENDQLVALIPNEKEIRERYIAQVPFILTEAKEQERERIAVIAWEYLNASICDICYEDDCGGEFSCTNGEDGEPCECHSRIEEARAKLVQALKQGG